MTIERGLALFSVAVIGLASACAAPSDESVHDSVASSPKRTDDPSTPPSSTSGRGTLPFKTKDGVKQLSVEVRNGRAYLGDMGFGRIGDQSTRSLGQTDIDNRWPVGLVPYCFETGGDLSSDMLQLVEAQMDYISARIPQVKFLRSQDNECGSFTLYVHSTGEHNSTSRSEVGYGLGADIELGLEAGAGVIRHELGHVLGLRHEQTRADRGNFVEVCLENVDPDHRDNFDFTDDAVPLAPYDYHSIMHYGRGLFLVANPSAHCGGFTMSALQDTFPDTASDIDTDFGQGSDFTRHDINTLSAMYGRKLASPTMGDRFGANVAIADFDADGYDDAVVASTRDAEDLPAGRGRLFFYKGTELGLIPIRILEPPTGDNDNGDLFGASLAVGDFDADGFPDLAVGAPHAAAHGSSTHAGLVRIFYGGQWRRANITSDCTNDVHCNSANNAGPFTRTGLVRRTSGLASTDAFGSALAVGRFTNPDRDELVVGAPGMSDGRGRAYRQNFADGSLTELGANQCTRLSGRCGAALTVGDFNGDGKHDLAIGSPANTIDVGRVYVYLKGATQLLFAQTLTLDDKGGFFGASLAPGHFRSLIGAANLAVGAPMAKNANGTRAGAVVIYEWSSTALTVAQTIRSGSSVEEHFGQAILPINVDTPPPLTVQELVVGAPNGASGGRIVLMKKLSGADLSNAQVLSSSELGFGSSFATGTIRSTLPNFLPPYRIRLLVGAPNAAANTGLTPWAGLVSAYDFTGGSMAVTAVPALTVQSYSFWAAP